MLYLMVKLLVMVIRKSCKASDSEWIKQFIDGLADGPVPFHYPAESVLDDLITGNTKS